MSVVKSTARVIPSSAKVSNHAKNVMPKAILEFSNGLPALIDAYYRFADQEGEFLGESKRMLDNISMQNSSDAAFKVIKESLLRQFPNDSKTHLRELAKFGKEFYSQRGSSDSFKFLFKALFQTNVDIDYPGDYVLKPSSGIWTQGTFIKLLFVDKLTDYQGLRFIGQSSGASASIMEMNVYAEGATLLANAAINDISGEFEIDEIVESTNQRGERIVTRTIGTCAHVEIVDPGAGYKEGTYIPLLTQGDGIGFSAKIKTVGDIGQILTIDIGSTGTGFIYEPPTLDMLHSTLVANGNFKEAIVNVKLVANFVEPGRYRIAKSAPSSIYAKLQDGNYYQNYSYALRTTIPLTSFEAPVKNLVHPAGTKMFAQPTFETGTGDYSNLSGGIIYRLSHPDDINYNDREKWSTQKFLDYNITSRDYMYALDLTAHQAHVIFIENYFELVDIDQITNARILIDTLAPLDISSDSTSDVFPELFSSYRAFDVFSFAFDDVEIAIEDGHDLIHAYGLSPMGNTDSILHTSSLSINSKPKLVFNAVTF